MTDYDYNDLPEDPREAYELGLAHAARPASTDDEPKGDMLTMADIKRMTEAQINEQWSEVQKVLEAGS